MDNIKLNYHPSVFESQIALNSGIYGDSHGSVIALNEKLVLLKKN